MVSYRTVWHTTPRHVMPYSTKMYCCLPYHVTLYHVMIRYAALDHIHIGWLSSIVSQ